MKKIEMVTVIAFKFSRNYFKLWVRDVIIGFDCDAWKFLWNPLWNTVYLKQMSEYQIGLSYACCKRRNRRILSKYQQRRTEIKMGPLMRVAKNGHAHCVSHLRMTYYALQFKVDM